MDLSRISKASLKSMVLYFMKLGATGFGGPIALTSAMQSDLVDKRGWFEQETFKEGMTLCQLAPGPLATQMAIYFGWAHSGVFGATIIGLAFVLPSFLMVVAIAMLYVHFGNIGFIQNIFYGIGPAAIAIVCIGARKLSRKNLGHDFFLWGVALVNALLTAVTESEIIWVVLLSGLIVMAAKAKSNTALHSFSAFSSLWTGVHGTATAETLTTIFLFFLRSGTFVFGSGLAIVPFLHGGVVLENQWLTEKQFLDAVAVAMITPGPVVITVAFIGFLVAGFAGACVAAIGTFLPCYLLTVLPAPHFSRLAKNRFLREFVSGVTAAAVGAILGAAIVLGRKSLVDGATLAIFFVTLVGLVYIKRIPEPVWILLAGAVGLACA